MKKRPIIIIAAVAALSVSVLLLSRNTVAYLMDTEAADNVVQIGQVEVSLDEGGYTDNSVVEIGRIIDKAPKLENTGKNDEYVFLQVDVPKENVTLLYEDTVANAHKEGEKNGTQGNYEIFKMLVDSGGTLVKQNDPQFVFNYHNGGNSTDGWIVLGTNPPAEQTIDGKTYSRYIFGYNKKLKVNAVTETLFDKVQLKSFIDGEVADNTTTSKNETVKVTAYAIQADDLNLDNVNTADTAYLDAAALEKIWKIIENKNPIGG